MDRLQRLQEETDGEFGETSRKTLNLLDQEITEMMLGEEKKCRKLYRGACEFSPEVKSWIEKAGRSRGCCDTDKPERETEATPGGQRGEPACRT